MKYNFDKVIDRFGFNTVKFDLLKSVFGSDDIIPMWVADMDFPTPEFIINDLKKRLNHNFLTYSFRSETFYQSIINWLKIRHNWPINKDWIVFCPGIVPALSFAIEAYTKPNDKIIVQTPVYYPFFKVIEENGRIVVNNPLKYENSYYTFDFENLINQIDSDVKMIFLSSPHNPVGRVWKKHELEKLTRICLDYNIIIFSDEIHSDLILPEFKHIPLSTLSKDVSNCTITAMAPSKTFNLSGLFTSAIIIENEKLRMDFTHVIDKLHVGHGNVFGNIALESAYCNGAEWLDQLLVYLQQNFCYLKNKLLESKLPISVLPLEGTYLVWLDCSQLNMSNSELRHFFINKAKLGLSAGYEFGKGGEGFMRMNIASPRIILERAVEQLIDAFKQI